MAGGDGAQAALRAMILRRYQDIALDEARAHMRAGKRRVMIVMPTGAGKRIMAGEAIRIAVARGKRCGFIVHRQELIDQTSSMLDDLGIPHGIIKAEVKPAPDALCQVASVQTLARRIVTPWDFLFVDEFHHAAAAGWASVINAHPATWVLGFTATPARLDGKGLAKYADAMVIGPGTRQLIDDGWLADYRYFAPPGADLGGVHTVAGDYHRAQLAGAVDRPEIVGDVVAHYQRLAPGSQAICFGVNVEHSIHLAEAFRAAGIAAEHVDGDTERNIRATALRDFAERRYQVLCNVDILGEGLDVAGIETVICARPTQSLTVYLQQVGRGLRVKPDGRKCVLLDHAGNVRRHGLPDEPRQWQLTEGKVKKPAEVHIKTCPSCFAVVQAFIRACPECGHVFGGELRQIRQVDGNLEEITAAQRLRNEWRRRENRHASSLDELIRLGRQRGYRYPEGWARHVWQARERRV